MRLRLLLILFIVAPIAILLLHFVAEFLAVDSCLDSGGVYDFTQASCRTDVQTLPYLSYLTHHDTLVITLGTLSLGSLLIWLATRLKWLRTPSESLA